MKIWDTRLAKNLGEEFESLWTWGEELDLKKSAKEQKSRGFGNG
jgi:hypothetical protein